MLLLLPHVEIKMNINDSLARLISQRVNVRGKQSNPASTSIHTKQRLYVAATDWTCTDADTQYTFRPMDFTDQSKL